MGPRLDIAGLTRCLAIAAALAVLLETQTACAAPARGVLDLLQPGSRAALGMGGDPFLSPLDDDVGWWWEFGERPTVSWTRLEAVRSVPLAPGVAGDGTSFSSRRWAWSGARHAQWLRRHWVVWGRVVSPRWKSAWFDGANGVDLQHSVMRVELGLRARDILPGLSVQMSGPVWESSGAAQDQRLLVGVRYRAGSWLALQGSWGRSRIPEELQSQLQGEPWTMSLNLASESRRADARMSLPWRFHVEGSFQRTDYSEVTVRDARPIYHLAPRGRTQVGQVAIGIEAPGGMQWLVRRTLGKLDTFGALSWGGQRFGRVDYARGELRSTLAALRIRFSPRTTWLFDVESVRVDANSRGYVETWPFTSTLIDLLGSRRTATARVHANWYRLHTGLQRGFGAFRGQLGLSWFDVQPEAELDHWRPAFLVFGRADPQHSVLTTNRIQLAGIAFGGQWDVAGIEAGFAVQQILPLRSFTSAKADRPSGDGANPEPSTARSAGTQNWPNGTTIEISLTRKF